MTSTADSALEARLNDFDPDLRRKALEALRGRPGAGGASSASDALAVNMHCHSFHSYNGYGLSPSGLAWLGRKLGLHAMGIVDFDVLDGVEEFLDAASRLGLRACAGMETRVFVPEFSDRVINSPGEPGISYHMGAGFVPGAIAEPAFLDRLKRTAQERNRDVVGRVNPALAPADLDYDHDVLRRTPSGNATERHICAAYVEAAVREFPDPEERAAFWSERLGVAEAAVRAILDDVPRLEALVRAKTMKAGGIGYVLPEGPGFPELEAVNAFVLANGAIPTMTWLDGTSPGEQAQSELMDVMAASGAAALNIIPDRNWNHADPAERRRKAELMNAVIAEAAARDWPILAGTEMNAPGQRQVDDFNAPEMARHRETFVEGARIFYAHTRMQAQAGMGLLSDWAGKCFATPRARNAFFAKLGAALEPGDAYGLSGVHLGLTPEEVLRAAGAR